MKIDSKIAAYEGRQLSNAISQTEHVNRPSKGTEVKQKDQDAVVHISQTSKEAQLAEEVISSTPEVRTDKVAEIKRSIESGNYVIDHEKVADKLIANHLEDIL
jgi:negative regulator of flagellin synthesis FlgM